MEGNFEVYQDGQVVGTVALSREGLYYRFRCRCRPLTDAVTRLVWKADEDVISLGILVPMGGCFGLDTRVAAKKCSGEKPEFLLVENGREDLLQRPKPADLPSAEPEETPEDGAALVGETEPEEIVSLSRFEPIREDAPFEALEELKNAVLAQQDGQLGALIIQPEE